MRIRLVVALAAMVLLGACSGSEDETAVMRVTPTAVARMAEQSGEAAPAAETAAEEPAVATEEPTAILEEPEEESTATLEPAQAQEEAKPVQATSTPAQAGSGRGPGGMGMGPGGGSAMRQFHMAPIPAEYAGVLSPVPADEESLERGQAAFVQNCASCHGEGGLGDGPAAAALVPAPPMIAMTSQMLGDDYMFWRVSEGGTFEPFNSAMPAWKSVLDEQTRWNVINYVRSLGAGQMPGGPGMNAETEQAIRAEMLAAGVEQGVISQEEADLFNTVHDQIDARRAADPERRFTGTMNDLQTLLLEELVAEGEVSQTDADAFNEIHERMIDAGLMQ